MDKQGDIKVFFGRAVEENLDALYGVAVRLTRNLRVLETIAAVAPLLGLLGTVVGMMGAFGKLAAAQNVSPDVLADDIRVALITTASGLAIAIPLTILTNSINIRIRRMEDLVGSGEFELGVAEASVVADIADGLLKELLVRVA